ncbi:hypothetical protein SEA_ARGAN_23 [Arthrobacter phage Argan]|nr:hypothetical protein SEA_UZUMAKI_24 [Arthrobacter phage Uzumaki]WNT45407.1 hypothetical protein SEA_ARGAN_23 [Arthrobacter phage Argan]
MSAIRYLLVNEENKVENTILWSSIDEYQAPEGLTIKVCENDEVGIGWDFIDGEWVNNLPPTVPFEAPPEDPAVLAAKEDALYQLMNLGITEPVARTIVGLPPL